MYGQMTTRRAAVTNTDAEEECEHSHEQAELAAKKTQHLLHGDTLDSGTATLDRKTCCVKV